MNNKRLRNKLFTMLMLVIALLIPQWGWAQEASQPKEGDGSKGNPFQISSAEELLWFRDWVNEGSPAHTSACAKLIANIDLSNIPWIPIANPQKGVFYYGTFDGNGQTISNLIYDNYEYQYAGFFGGLQGATIKNITFDKANVKNSIGGSEQVTGIVAGQARISSILGIRITNSKVEGGDHVGSIVGVSLSSQIVNCNSESDVYGSSYVGGIVGFFNSMSGKANILRNIFSSSNVSFKYSEGGLLVGEIYQEAIVRTAGFVVYNKDAKLVKGTTELQGDEKNSIGYGTLTAGFMLGCTKETLKSGVIAYMLQQKNGTDDITWGQNISTENGDAYPILGSPNRVYTNSDVTLSCQGSLSYTGTFTNEKIEDKDIYINHSSPSTHQDGTAATCTKDGILEHYECSTCHSAFKDAQLTSEMADITDPMKSHHYDEDDICVYCKKEMPIVKLGENTIQLEMTTDPDNLITGFSLFKFTPTETGILEYGINDANRFATSLWNSDKSERLLYNALGDCAPLKIEKNTTYYIGVKAYLVNYLSNRTLTIYLTSCPNDLVGDGNKSNPFILKSEGHLKFFADYVNGTAPISSTHYDACAKIADDVDEIDMSSICHAAGNGYTSEASWTPIGSSNVKWQGVFDGNGKTISNLYINGNQNQLGLFGYVWGNIKNLTISNATVINNTSQSETGILMGYTYGSTIQNIVIDSKSSINAGECTGGIAGNANRSNFYNCINHAKVSGTNKVGGIAGFTENNTLSNVFGYGDVTATEENSGGIIVGQFSKTSSSGVVAYNKEAVLTINGTQVEAKATGSGSLSSTAYTKDEVKSGKLTYALNSGVTDGSQIWYQKLGKDGDEYPMMKSTGENTVYGAYHHGDKDRFFSNTVITNQHSVAYNAEAENEENGNHDVSYEAGEYTWTDAKDKAQDPTVAVTYTCKVCGNAVTPEQMAVEHDAEHDNEAATCTEEGHNYYKTSHTFNDKAVFSNAYTQTLPALGHNMSDEVTFNDSKSIYQKGCTRENCDHHDYYATSDGNVVAKANDDASAFTVDNFTLNDATAYDSKAKFTVKELTYKRTFKNTGWQAVYVPFSLECGQINQDYEVANINNFHEYEQTDGSTNLELEVKRVANAGNISALTPCLIRKKQVSDIEQETAEPFHFTDVTFVPAEDKSIDCASVTRYYQFVGTLQGKSDFDVNSDFCIGQGELWPAVNGKELSPQRWYLKATDRTGGSIAPTAQLSRIAIRVIGDGEATGIENIHVTTDYGTVNGGKQGIYDLQGRKLDKEPESGIYIKNGKKYVK